MGVAGGNPSSMDLNRPFGDGEAESDAACGAVAIRADAVKGIENPGEAFFRHARSAVADCNCSVGTRAFQFHVDGSSGRCVADGVANHVLDGAAQQFRVPFHEDFLTVEKTHFALSRLCFDGGIVDDFADEFTERYLSLP